MSKRWLSVLGAMLICLGILSGCKASSQQPDVPTADNANISADTSLQDIYDVISGLGILPEMYMLEDAYVSGYYGITDDEISDKVFAVADDSLLADTVIIVKAVDSLKAEEIRDGFVSINDQRKVELEAYNPEQFSRVEDAVIGTYGEYVYYIVTDDNNAVEEVLESNII